MKRFWKAATVQPCEGDDTGWQVLLDERPVRTPAREALVVPTEALARAIAAEWNGAGETVDPRAMPLTGLANAAIDRVGPAAEAFAHGLARYAEADLFCYRAAQPASLVAAQAAAWEPLLQWARRRYDIDFAVTDGALHVEQPAQAPRRLASEVCARDPFRLAALSPLVTIGGSLVAALAVAEGAATPEQAFDAVSLDDRWQAEKWGADAEAEAALEGRRRDFLAAARFLALLEG